MGGKEEFFAKKTEIRQRLDQTSQRFNDLKEQKDKLMQQVQGNKEQGLAMRSELNKLKKTMAFTSEEHIDERIMAIEHQMLTDTMTLKEEKKMMAEIADLKKSRPKVSHYNQMEENIRNFAPDLTIKEQIDSVKQQ